MKFVIMSFLLVASISSFADISPTGVIHCTAQALISGKWDVTLNTETRALEIKTSGGSVYKGTTNYLYSSNQKFHTYFLALDHAAGVSIRVDLRAGREVGMCLKQNECYLCRE